METEKKEGQMEAEEFQDLGEVDLNKFGRPKQNVIFFELTEQIKLDALDQIGKDNTFMTEEQYSKITGSSAKTWDKFYKNHQCNFFKDRTYFEREIPELTQFRERHEQTKQQFVFVELGCGVGNTLFPILHQFPFFRLYGCDFAASAITLMKEQLQKQKCERMKVEVCDLVKDEIPGYFEPGDIVSLVFVLSAIAPEHHKMVLKKIYDWMKPGSYLYFRDYGRYDFGQLNLSRKGNRKLKDNFYAKNDGVCVYYFEQEELEGMCEEVGFEKINVALACKLLQNRKTGLKMYRIWMQGRFYKPLDGAVKKQKQGEMTKQEIKEEPKEDLDELTLTPKREQVMSPKQPPSSPFEL